MNEVEVFLHYPVVAVKDKQDRYSTRPATAEEIAFRLVRNDTVFDLGKDGVLFSGRPGTGKTTLVRDEVQKTLQIDVANSIPIYVELKKNSTVSTSDAIKQAVTTAVTKNTNLMQRWRTRLADSAKMKLGLKVKAGTEALGGELEVGVENRDKAAKRDCDLVRDMLIDLHQHTGKTVVMMVDGIEHALATNEGAMMLQAIKDAKAHSNVERTTVAITNLYITSLCTNVTELTGPNEILEKMPVMQLPDLDMEFVKAYAESWGLSFKTDRLPDDKDLHDCFKALNRDAKAFDEVFVNALKMKGKNPTFTDALRICTERYLSFESDRITKALGVAANPVPLAILSELCLRNDYSQFLSPANINHMSGLRDAIVLERQESGLWPKDTTPLAPLTREQVQEALDQLVKSGLVWRSYSGMYLLENPYVYQWAQDNKLIQNVEIKTHLDEAEQTENVNAAPRG